MNWTLEPGVSCYDRKYKHEILKTLKLWPQMKSHGPRAINNSLILKYWSVKTCNLHSCEGCCCSWQQQLLKKYKQLSNRARKQQGCSLVKEHLSSIIPYAVQHGCSSHILKDPNLASVCFGKRCILQFYTCPVIQPSPSPTEEFFNQATFTSATRTIKNKRQQARNMVLAPWYCTVTDNLGCQSDMSDCFEYKMIMVTV